MVETITPVVHGGRRSRWALFLLVHVAGATLAAAAFGALLGGAGALFGAPWGAAGLVVVVVASLAYLGREVLGVPVPVPQLRRQVPDWWRTFFPFAPAAFLYGLGLGVGFLTFLRHGTLVVVATSAVASGRPIAGAVLLAPFGLARGATAVVARRARTPEASAALVARLAETASARGWSLAHGTVLAAIATVGLVAIAVRSTAGEPGALAAAVISVAFGAAVAAKITRPRRWRRALAAYGLSPRVERGAAIVVPALEVAVAAMPALGLRSSAGAAASVTLLIFSAAIVLARVRSGTRVGCGCFGGASSRDYRALLARNGVLLVAAAVAWRSATDRFLLPSFRWPRPAEALPAAIVVLGAALAAWVLGRTWTDLRHRPRI